MYQRLLFILSVLFISGSLMAQNVMNPADGDYIYDSTATPGSLTNPIPVGPNTMQKWVHMPNQDGKVGRIPWNQSSFKSYRWGTQSFRLRFPNNYDPTKKYPLVVFLHGQGESCNSTNKYNLNGADRENQDQLFWGADTFMLRINRGEWNGFLLFPQLFQGTNGAGAQWGDPNIPPLTNILDTLEKYNGLDPNRVIAMGLSAGALGALKFANLYPKRIAAVICAGPEAITDVTGSSSIENYVQIPIWATAGGVDANPYPGTVFNARDAIASHGADFYLGYYPSLTHQTWDVQWDARDTNYNRLLTYYWNNANKSQPLVYFQNNVYCNGQPISTKLGITAGYYAYEWQNDLGAGFTTIAGATSNIYTATQAGKYQVHFKRAIDSPWSAWSPNPVVISTKKCTADTAFVENFEEKPTNQYVAFSGSGNGNGSPYFFQNINCQNGIIANATQDNFFNPETAFSRDALGRQTGRFMINNTSVSTTNCNYAVGDQVWRTYYPATVTQNTDYVLNFYVGNQTKATPLAALGAKINNVALTPIGVSTTLAGNASWKKYSFLWNSGFSTNAEIAVINNTATGSGNDFVLDEISLVKAAPVPFPGAAFKNASLWAKAGTIIGADGSPVGLWPNSNINGDNLQQEQSNFPVLKTSAAESMNFNPIVNFTAANNQFLQALNGYSGSTVHTAAHAFIVAKFNNLLQDNRNVLVEGQLSGQVAVTLRNNAGLSWQAGTNILYAPNNSIDSGKATVWSFSKNTNNTASGNKQDIRKNGVVIASSNTPEASTTFTGNKKVFDIGNIGQVFSGNIAEVVYILDSAITPLKQSRIESYLALKYGTTLGSTLTTANYIASDSTTVFWTGNTKFQNDVFGIGTDSLSGLVQQISNSVNTGSGDGTGQPGKGNLVLSTNTELNDKSFLMIGNNAASLTQTTIVSANPLINGSARVGRNWKVDNTGSVGPVTLSFDTTGLGLQSGGSILNKYSLLISNTGDTTYSGTVSFFGATGASGKKIIFSGTTLTNNAVFTIITNNVNLALPAVWLGFTAKAVNENGVLNWKTGDEMNVDHYVVEHSFNGVSFSAIGNVTANNNTGVNNYNFTHTGLAAGLHYYRIRRIDKDGKSDLSDTQVIKITITGANVQVRPNPVVGSTLVLAISVEQNTKTLIQVMGVDGKVIAQQNVGLASGSTLTSINISTVPPGIYMVRVQLNDQVVTKKFIKQHN